VVGIGAGGPYAAARRSCSGRRTLMAVTWSLFAGLAKPRCIDPARKRVVLFGGTVDRQDVGETWEWDGARWTEVRGLPPDA
jgi:hypothetical protein